MAGTEVGVPEIRPAVLIDIPAGSAPEAIVQLYGEVPPDALSCWLGYATFFVALGKVGAVMVKDGQFTVMAYTPDLAQPLASVAVMVML